MEIPNNPIGSTPKKPIQRQWPFWAAVAFIAIAAIIGSQTQKGSSNVSFNGTTTPYNTDRPAYTGIAYPTEKPTPVPTSAEDAAAAKYKAWVDAQFSFWDGHHTALVDLLKEHLNDPKSFEHVKTTYTDNGDSLTIFMTYRAKNAFGGLVLQNVTATADYATNTIKIISSND